MTIYRQPLSILSIALVTLSLSACNNTADPQEKAVAEDNVAYETKEIKPNGQQQEVDEALSEESISSSNEPVKPVIKIPEIPLSAYHNLNVDSDFSWLTPLYIAQAPDEFSEEEKLNLMSPEYYNEQDVFKKQELKQALLPKIEQKIATYRGDYRIKVPIISDGTEFYYQQQELDLTNTSINKFTLSPYDFENKSFPIQGDCIGFNMGVGNEQNIRLLQVGSERVRQVQFENEAIVPPKDCYIEVKDEALARRIETLRSENKLLSRGMMYYRLGANRDHLVAYPEFADIDFYDETTDEVLKSKRLTFEVAIEE